LSANDPKRTNALSRYCRWLEQLSATQAKTDAHDTHGPRFTISLKRSTQNLQPIHKLPADYPIYWHKADKQTAPKFVRFRTKADKDGLLACTGLFANDPPRHRGSSDLATR
jgi:hypothetical protein